MRFDSAICGVVAAALVGTIIAACGSDGSSDDSVPECLSTAPAPCTTLYAPTFDKVWKNTLSMTCAATGCHSGATPQAGMAFDKGQDEAYANLMSNGRVRAGDVRCGKATVRLHSQGKSYVMPPPGSNLPSGALCSISQWIANGATNP